MSTPRQRGRDRAGLRTARVGSADPDDFAVPTGREEDWRFTPLNRLRGLHAARAALPAR